MFRLAPSLRSALSLLMATTALVWLIQPAETHAEEAPPSTFSYRGEMVDGSLTPISGVFSLTFSLREGRDAARSLWTETHWVGVVEGMYELDLGTLEPIPDELFGRDLTIVVQMGEDAELTRHALQPQRRAARTDARIPDIEQIVFADLAERALSAERARVADDCRTLDGRTIAELELPAEAQRRIQEIQQQIRDLRGSVSAASSGGSSRVGTPTQTLPRIGGAGGRAYDRACPPNHVVVGARGRMGDLIDSIELVCAPLQ